MKKDPFDEIFGDVFTTISTGTISSSTLTIEDIKKAMTEVEKLGPPNKEWILINPQGKAWRSEDPLQLGAYLISQVKFEKLPQNMEQTLHDNMSDLYER